MYKIKIADADLRGEQARQIFDDVFELKAEDLKGVNSKMKPE